MPPGHCSDWRKGLREIYFGEKPSWIAGFAADTTPVITKVKAFASILGYRCRVHSSIKSTICRLICTGDSLTFI